MPVAPVVVMAPVVVVTMTVVMVTPVIVMPVAAMTVVQFVANLANDVERPFMAVAAPSDDRVGEEIDANANRDRAAIRLGLRGRAGRQCEAKRQRRHRH